MTPRKQGLGVAASNGSTPKSTASSFHSVVEDQGEFEVTKKVTTPTNAPNAHFSTFRPELS